ncbi:hypothetical protein DH2020_031135 [Rehmannia glutinosa]|uniref:Uncharacterized protein n=1 Tax=Rehmannia glutinosa TaxID=99300 RepID=A0ABR0VM94_REHGL
MVISRRSTYQRILKWSERSTSCRRASDVGLPVDVIIAASGNLLLLKVRLEQLLFAVLLYEILILPSFMHLYSRENLQDLTHAILSSDAMLEVSGIIK